MQVTSVKQCKNTHTYIQNEKKQIKNKKKDRVAAGVQFLTIQYKECKRERRKKKEQSIKFLQMLGKEEVEGLNISI